MNLEKVQLKLVYDSEKPNEYGFRHTGISGAICTRLLRDFLRKQFTSLRFDEGVVTKQRERGISPETKELSPQCDIIAYHDSPWKRRFEYVVVPLKNVNFVIEVKKWVTPSTSSTSQIEKQKQFLKKPVFLVGFRHHGELRKVKADSKATKTYLFSKATPNKYPWEVRNFIEEYLHKGELTRLVTDIKRTIL